MVIWSTRAGAHAFLTMQNTYIPQCSVSGPAGLSRGPEAACGPFHLHSFLTGPLKEEDHPVSEPSWCVWAHSHASPPPSHICTLCQNHMCPQSLKQEVKDDLEDAFKKLSNRNEGCFQEGRTATGGINTTWGTFRNEGCHNIIIANKSPVKDWGQPRKMKNMP